MTLAIDLQPTLVGPRITARPVVPADWDGMYSAARDPGIWALHPASDRYLEPVFRKFFDDALACGSALSFVDRHSGSIIGSSRYHGHDPAAGEIEIGWTFLARAYWGKNYNREVKQLMLAHAFSFVDTVVFWVGEKNERSKRAMQKIGGVLRDGLYYRPIGEIAHAHVVFEIHKDRFEWKSDTELVASGQAAN